MPSINRSILEGLIGVRVNDPGVYSRAFMHKSLIKESNGLITESYERIEFMGDAVINFIVTRYLFEKYPDKDEGFLTRIRTKVVSGKCLSKLALKLGLQDYIQMNEKAMQNSWNLNDRILEDVFESLMGCIYMDLGLAVARDFLVRTIETHVDFHETERDDNFKDILMRFTQARGVALPVYACHETMVEGKKQFEIRCIVDGKSCGYGRNKNKKQAEQNAAYQSLLYFGIEV
jgi:ribonuclease III